MSYRPDITYSPTPDFQVPQSTYIPENFEKLPQEAQVNLWRKTLEGGLSGICFSLYAEGQRPGDSIDAEQVNRRIQIVKPYVQAIRSFSTIEGNENIPRIAHENGMQTLVGAWLGPDLDKNEREIASLIALAHEGCVTIAAVGNEVLYRNDLTEEQLIAYIIRVREALPPSIPVGYVDAYYEFSHRPALTEVCDVVLANCYPYWEGCPIEYALSHMQSMYNGAKEAGKGRPVIITETGWPSAGGSLRGAVASAENAIRYFIEAQHWSREAQIPIYYFSSFDESWKVGTEGDVGAYWGLWDSHEKLKF
jgi:glucan 1,3-beta-glucosidase